MAYDDDARAAITALKNRGERARITALADAMAALVVSVEGIVITWAPTGPARRRQRGFDQAELLARAIARRRGLRVESLLRRLSGPAQAGRSAEERRAGPRLIARRRWDLPVLVVDDVATTGATLTAAAAALRAAGVPEVHGLVVARAPRPNGRYGP